MLTEETGGRRDGCCPDVKLARQNLLTSHPQEQRADGDCSLLTDEPVSKVFISTEEKSASCGVFSTPPLEELRFARRSETHSRHWVKVRTRLGLRSERKGNSISAKVGGEQVGPLDEVC